MRRISITILCFFVIVLSTIFFTALFVSLKTPSLDRDWEDDSKILPSVIISSSTAEFTNLRDWRYQNSEVVSSDYYNERFDLSKTNGLYLAYNPFGKWEGVGHSFLIFTFSDGKSVSVSIEARREKGEVYQAIKKGLFNEYEVWYAWGSPADFMTRRAIYHNEDLYMYQIMVTEETMRTLFIDLAQTTHNLETTPAFYNTLTSNCTNLLADSANRINPGSIPWNKARLFTGYADNQLYDLGLIENGKPFNEVFEKARIDINIRDFFERFPQNTKEEFDEKYFGITNKICARGCVSPLTIYPNPLEQ